MPDLAAADAMLRAILIDPDDDLARADLESAMARYGRSLAGLPPLTPAD